MTTPENVAKALKDLQAAGAHVHDSSKDGEKITAAAVHKLASDEGIDFTAWISWSKAF